MSQTVHLKTSPSAYFSLILLQEATASGRLLFLFPETTQARIPMLIRESSVQIRALLCGARVRSQLEQAEQL